MEINIDKCELLSDDIKDTIIDKTTNKSIRTSPHSKYLGQKINNKFEAEDVILRRNYQSIHFYNHTISNRTAQSLHKVQIYSPSTPKRN